MLRQNKNIFIRCLISLFFLIAPACVCAAEYIKDETPDLKIPDCSSTTFQPGKVTSTLTVTGDVLINDVRIYLDIEHGFIGDLNIDLYSAEGTTVRIKTDDISDDSTELKSWFSVDKDGLDLSSFFSDEESSGTWHLKIMDVYNTSTGTVKLWKLDIQGSTIKFKNVSPGEKFTEVLKQIQVDAVNSITEVKFYINNVLEYTDNSSPFSWDMDSTEYMVGSHQLKAQAYKNSVLVQTITCSISIEETYYCVIVYPNPVYPSRGDNKISFSGSGVPNSKIEIFTIDGEEIAELKEGSGSDKLSWDLYTSRGKLPSGIYIYRAVNGLEENVGKFTISK